MIKTCVFNAYANTLFYSGEEGNELWVEAEQFYFKNQIFLIKTVVKVITLILKSVEESYLSFRCAGSKVQGW